VPACCLLCPGLGLLVCRYESAAGLHELLLLGESDAWLALGLAFQLSGGDIISRRGHLGNPLPPVQ
jgi:hypothetical protein